MSSKFDKNMRDYIKFFTISLFFRALQSLPFSSENIITVDPELQSELFEGDMILNAEQVQSITNFTNITSIMKASPRNGLTSISYLWPNKVVLYRISNEFTQPQAEYILQAMLHIANRTCLRFRPAPPHCRSYAYISGNDNMGCYSSVGYQGRPQFINLQRHSPSCLRLGSIVHELMHTIGFYHEQSAPNRDLYVRVLLENVQFGKEHNFAKYPSGQVSNYGLGYDYSSVMHYGSKAFTKNGLDTIEAIYGNMTTIGQRAGLSKKDVQKINKMYEC